MIQDMPTLERLRKEWEGVRSNHRKIRSAISVTGASAAIGAVSLLTRPQGLADLCQSLVVVLAYGVLERTLEAIRDESHFSSNARFLGGIMEDSQQTINWINFALVNEGKNKRNDIAHRSEILPRAKSEEYIDAIEAELRGWGVL